MGITGPGRPKAEIPPSLARFHPAFRPDADKSFGVPEDSVNCAKRHPLSPLSTSFGVPRRCGFADDAAGFSTPGPGGMSRRGQACGSMRDKVQSPISTGTHILSHLFS